jgi:Fic/DOC family protein
MADWDENSPILQKNLRNILQLIEDDSHKRVMPTLQHVRMWQSETMKGLVVPDPDYVGKFRGETGLENIGVRIGIYKGTPSHGVADELSKFETMLHNVAKALDAQIKPGKSCTAQDLLAIIDLCAWVHAEWVRIHPFANGNGRTARLWVNAIAMRYGLPPFLQLRPRPGDGYEFAAVQAMQNNWKAGVPVFRDLLNRALEL